MLETERQPEIRQRLIGALAVVIARDGFSGSKIQDIVKEARTSLRTFYALFPSKEACFLELHQEVLATVTTVVRESVVFDRPWREVMRAGFETYYGVLTAQPRLTTAMVIELATLGPEAREARERAVQTWADLLSELVDRGREANPDIPSRSLPPYMARAIIGGVLELMLSFIVNDEIELLPQLVDTSTDMLWSVVTAVDEVTPA